MQLDQLVSGVRCQHSRFSGQAALTPETLKRYSFLKKLKYSSVQR